MSHLKVKCVMLIVGVALCIGFEVYAISIPVVTTSSVSVIATAASTQTSSKGCQDDYKKIIKNEQGKQVGFVHTWTSTCDGNNQTQVQIGSWTD